jgi:hypothetical protein
VFISRPPLMVELLEGAKDREAAVSLRSRAAAEVRDESTQMPALRVVSLAKVKPPMVELRLPMVMLAASREDCRTFSLAADAVSRS